MHRFRRFVGFKLFASIFVSMAAVFFVFSFLAERRTEEAWRKSFDEHGRQTAAVLERALHNAMLLGKKEGVRSALGSLASEPGVAGVRIYDKKGRIKFATDTAEVKKKLEKTEPACATCHDAELAGRPALTQGSSWTYRDPSGRLLMGSVYLIESSRECSSADCHEHSEKKTALGVLDLRLRMDVVDEGRRESQKATMVTTVWMAGAGGLVTAAFVWFFMRRPVRRLIAGARQVSAAGFHTRIHVAGTDEFSEIAEAFNAMTADLERAHARTEQFEAELQAAIDRKSEELGRAHKTLTQMEKMASLGKLAATVAHEINNPLAGILVYAKLVDRELAGEELTPESRAEMRRWVEVIRSESARCGEIVKNLLTFARQSKAELAPASLREIVERSCRTVDHMIKHAGVECQIDSSLTSDEVVCDKNQIQQALVALLVNAIEAMPSGGQLSIGIGEAEGQVVVTVSDTGTGIPSDVLPHIFEPFVTTKAEKGVGLGLSVVYGIVRRHEGQIEVDSAPDKGTTFRISLPRKAP